MIELIEIKTDSALYNYAEQLMTTSFPQEERRDTEQQRVCLFPTYAVRCVEVGDRVHPSRSGI